ncbi:MAG: NAD(P)-dependent oxidoreductase [Planctomycetes bacterium]|nr:NAD(P)-dependent oxidoreductase [Planctomycetota bacterium]
MTTIALLGTGLLGAGFVESLLGKGHTVRIWNRSKDKLPPLVAKGAVAAADPAECVRGAERVHLVLAEDTAVDEVIAALRPGLGDGVPVIDHSTNLPAKVRARTEKLRGEGVRYVSAPVFMSPTNAREASGLMALSCPEAEAKELEPALAAMTGKLWYCGERSDLAAIHKLSGNGVYFALTAIVGDVLAIGRAEGVDAKTALELFDNFKPGGAMPFIGQRLANSLDGPPSFELTMARKDARLMIETAGADQLTVLPAIAAAMDRALAKGHAASDFAVFAAKAD